MPFLVLISNPEKPEVVIGIDCYQKYHQILRHICNEISHKIHLLCTASEMASCKLTGKRRRGGAFFLFAEHISKCPHCLPYPFRLLRRKGEAQDRRAKAFHCLSVSQKRQRARIIDGIVAEPAVILYREFFLV